MRDKIMINNKNYDMKIFNSLMSVRITANTVKTRDELVRDLKEFEAQGKLKIYYPEVQ